MSFCGQCGAAASGMSFCAECGHRLGVAVPPVPSMAAVSREAPSRASAQPPPPPLFSGPEPDGPNRPAPPPHEANRLHSGRSASGLRPLAPESRSRRKYWWLAVGALVAVLAGGAFTAYTLYFSKTGGAQTPEAAVTEFAAAVNDKDLVQAALLLPPNELQSLRDSFTAAGDAAVRTGFAEGTADLPSVLAGAEVSIEGLRVTAEQVAPELAKVTLQSGTFSIGIDPTATSGITRDMMDAATVDWQRQGRFSVDVATITEMLGRKPYIMVVNRDGGWYVSPLFTAGEYLSDSTGAPRAPATLGDGQTTTYSSPEAAAEEFVRTIAGTINDGDSRSLAEVLPPDEALAVLMYRRSLNALLEGAQEVSVTMRDVQFTALSDSGDVRLVRPDLVAFDGSDRRNTGSFENQGQCLFRDDDRESCVGSYLPPVLESVEFSLVAVQSGEGWRISPLATAAATIKQVLDNLSPSQALTLAATLSNDSEAVEQALFTLPSVTAVNINQRVDLQFDRSEAYHIVEVTVGDTADEPQFSGASGACAVGRMLKPSGTSESGFSSLDEIGTYKFVVYPYLDDDDGRLQNYRVTTCSFGVESP